MPFRHIKSLQLTYITSLFDVITGDLVVIFFSFDLLFCFVFFFLEREKRERGTERERERDRERERGGGEEREQEGVEKRVLVSKTLLKKIVKNETSL